MEVADSYYRSEVFVGNILLCRACLGIRKVKTQGENLVALPAKFDNRGEVAGSCYVVHVLCISAPEFNKDQQETICFTYRWYYHAVEGQAPKILYFQNQSEQFH